jgi:opacity protein-like surface antigen
MSGGNRSGGTAGGGIEYGFDPGWTLKAEYLHVDLRKGGGSIRNCSALSVVNAPLYTENLYG